MGKSIRKMQRLMPTFTAFCCFAVFQTASSSATSPLSTSKYNLNGRHIKAIWTLWAGEVQGNKTIFGSKANGQQMQLLAQRFNFTFSYAPLNLSMLFSGNVLKGLLQLVADGEGDVLAHSVAPNPNSIKSFDFTFPWGFSDAVFLIPKPEPLTNNAAAVVKPFQWPIWLLLAVSIPLVIASIELVNFLVRQLRNKRPKHRRVSNAKRAQSNNAYIYVFGTLMSQGGPCTWKSESVILLAASWCLAAFVLVNSYSSTLITYVITNESPPLIKDVHDVAANPHINVIVRRGHSIGDFFMEPSNTGVLKVVGDRIRAYPKSRCDEVLDCVGMVKDYRYNVFAMNVHWSTDAIITDYQLTGSCNVQLTTEPYTKSASSFTLRKNSVYTEALSLGLLELHTFGFWLELSKRVRPIPTGAQRCFDTASRRSTDTVAQKLTLNNLFGAFVVLFVGYAMSFVALLLERFFAARR